MLKIRLTLSLLVIYSAAVQSTKNACGDFEMVRRSSWGARGHHSGNDRLLVPVSRVIIGHTVTPWCYGEADCSRNMRSMQNYHMDQHGWPDIGYNFVIGGDARVYEGAGWTNQGIHVRGFNDKSLAIAFIGNFMNSEPTHEMIEAGKKLIICGIQKGFIEREREVHGARDATCTLSPGDKLYNVIKKWPRFKAGPLPGYRC